MLPGQLICLSRQTKKRHCSIGNS